MIDKRKGMVLITLVLTIILFACGKNEEKSGTTNGNAATISISGSTSVGPLAEKLAEKYKEKNNVNIEINQIGSSAGITNAVNGVSEIGMSSRDLKEEEKASLQETVIAYDGIVVVTHPSNHVKNLTIAQVKDIFTGKITNWKEVGGDDLEIVVVSREDGSGSRDAFQEIVGYSSGELVRNSIIASGNGNIKTTVATNKHAVGFISFEYIDESINTVSINGVEATAENVLRQKYSLSRPFLFVHKEENLSDEGKKFIDFILSSEGQKIVRETGAIPVKM
ncbi:MULTISPECIES: phosphate ABC transporter substrate-binding protein [Bacillaceae]|uniref:phosphate ABC transporter substrate-binding protein n=1 Tax=Bacillaceae TaxID=186817 RepID=UPI000D54CFAE|nr:MULTISPECIES: phosphate ABC transporter substrate-binding protein [Bacillaceae]AWI11745.1 phosphate ABC transporter substrate-binding protein [Caldibacillus thermoamylovorans]MCM3053866.1 phosphate ABC transporter substrate-binding protein [Caldibacillus thermoamylovorans]MCM3475951.1 phosphate ABC transporter substrate-binding protein [Caldibacillus thermoamylovorans]MEC5272346.1 phosphate ABC transporter substrate-binding protein [Caldifermentibacillus hisashii]MED3642877.1 phosphate ABC 